MKMTYSEFESVLSHDNYGAQEIRHLFNAVKAMSAKSRLWVIKWILTGELPEEAVEDVTAEELIQEYGFKPMNAFIVLDWLQTDPQAAKYFILKNHSGFVPSEEIAQEMRDFLQANNVAETPLLNCEETGDEVE